MEQSNLDAPTDDMENIDLSWQDAHLMIKCRKKIAGTSRKLRYTYKITIKVACMSGRRIKLLYPML